MEMTKELAIAIATEPSCFFDRTAQEQRRVRVMAVRDWMLQQKGLYEHPEWSSVVCLPMGGPQKLELDVITLSLELVSHF